MARGNGECPIFKVTRKYKNGEEYFIYAFEIVLANGERKKFYSRKGEKKGDFQKRKTKIMLDYQRTVNVSISSITMEQFLNNWIAQKRDIAATTRKVYSDYLEWYIKPLIGSTPLQKITQDDMNTSSLICKPRAASQSKMMSLRNSSPSPLHHYAKLNSC